MTDLKARDSRSGNSEGQWNQMARMWDRHGPPLRPSALDVERYQDAVDALAEQMPITTAVILGVTPEIQELAWPEGTQVVGCDRSPSMIEAVWRGQREDAVLGQWTDPLFAPASVQIVMCDGGLHLLGYPDGQERLVAQLARMLVPGGRAVFRLFLPPDPCPSPDEVLDRLEDGAIASMSELKLALGHAMTSHAAQGVSLDAIWHRLHERIGFEERERFFGLLDWSRREYEVIDLYQASPVHYHFASLEEVLWLFCGKAMEGDFRLCSVSAASPDTWLPCRHLTVERK